MNYKDFKAAVALDANEPRDYEQIVFRTPDGTNYCNVKIDFTTCGDTKDKVILIDLFNIKSKFKVGDKVTNDNGLFPDRGYTIAEVNEKEQYYTYKEVFGKTSFKDQDKLTLVETDNCKPPVEDDTKPASTVKVNPNIIPANILNINKDSYDTYTAIVQQIMSAIKCDAKQGNSKAHFIIKEGNISVFQLGQDFKNAGYKVSAVIGNDKNSTLDIEW